MGKCNNFGQEGWIEHAMLHCLSYEVERMELIQNLSNIKMTYNLIDFF